MEKTSPKKPPHDFHNQNPLGKDLKKRKEQRMQKAAGGLVNAQVLGVDL